MSWRAGIPECPLASTVTVFVTVLGENWTKWETRQSSNIYHNSLIISWLCCTECFWVFPGIRL